ncbi:hypothetical protein, partial [Pseudomonas atacamensis]|uniref:hypothetical protein n=1 Tax=Pseudomonas atacamensis TaxID=2565368 RepID=UPI003CEC5B96
GDLRADDFLFDAINPARLLESASLKIKVKSSQPAACPTACCRAVPFSRVLDVLVCDNRHVDR